MTDSQSAQQAHAERALQIDMHANTASRPDNMRIGHDGMTATPRENYSPSGAFDAEGREPALRRSRER